MSGAINASNQLVINNHATAADMRGTGHVTLTAVPESSAFALIGGFMALGFVMLRRRRKSADR